jgi:hypothetical protein
MGGYLPIRGSLSQAENGIAGRKLASAFVRRTRGMSRHRKSTRQAFAT